MSARIRRYVAPTRVFELLVTHSVNHIVGAYCFIGYTSIFCYGRPARRGAGIMSRTGSDRTELIEHSRKPRAQLSPRSTVQTGLNDHRDRAYSAHQPCSPRCRHAGQCQRSGHQSQPPHDASSPIGEQFFSPGSGVANCVEHVAGTLGLCRRPAEGAHRPVGVAGRSCNETGRVGHGSQ